MNKLEEVFLELDLNLLVWGFELKLGTRSCRFIRYEIPRNCAVFGVNIEIGLRFKDRWI